MFRNRIHFEDGRETKGRYFGRAVTAALATLVIGGALVLAQGNDVKAENGTTAQTTVKIAMVETAAPVLPAPQAVATPAPTRKQIRVIPLFNVPADQQTAERR